MHVMIAYQIFYTASELPPSLQFFPVQTQGSCRLVHFLVCAAKKRTSLVQMLWCHHGCLVPECPRSVVANPIAVQGCDSSGTLQGSGPSISGLAYRTQPNIIRRKGTVHMYRHHNKVPVLQKCKLHTFIPVP